MKTALLFLAMANAFVLFHGSPEQEIDLKPCQVISDLTHQASCIFTNEMLLYRPSLQRPFQPACYVARAPALHKTCFLSPQSKDLLAVGENVAIKTLWSHLSLNLARLDDPVAYLSAFGLAQKIDLYRFEEPSKQSSKPKIGRCKL